MVAAALVAAPLRRIALVGGAIALPRPVERPASRVRAWFGALPDHRLLERLIRGRAWIFLLGVLLAGLVALQVSLLKMNAGISRAVETEQTLTGQNQALQESVARAQARLPQLASVAGYYVPAAGSQHFVGLGSADARRARSRIRPPDPAGAGPASLGTAPSTGTTSTGATSTGATTTGATSTSTSTSSTTSSGPPAGTGGTASPGGTPAATTTSSSSGGATPAAGQPAAPPTGTTVSPPPATGQAAGGAAAPPG